MYQTTWRHTIAEDNNRQIAKWRVLKTEELHARAQHACAVTWALTGASKGRHAQCYGVKYYLLQKFNLCANRRLCHYGTDCETKPFYNHERWDKWGSERGRQETAEQIALNLYLHRLLKFCLWQLARKGHPVLPCARHLDDIINKKQGPQNILL
jgi:hypothetical protein